MAQEMAEDRPRGGGRSGHSGGTDEGEDSPSPDATATDASASPRKAPEPSGSSPQISALSGSSPQVAELSGETGPGTQPSGSTLQVLPEVEQERRGRLRHRLTQALAVAVIVAVFAFIFPRIASYGAAWRVVSSMTAPWILALAGVTVLNLVVNWWFVMTCLPGLGLPRAAAMNLSSTAVANTVPAGGAIALGVSWNMASAWGYSGEEFTLYTLVSGLWSQFAKFGTPAVALIALSAVGSANRSLVLATVLGTAVFLAALGAVIAALHSDGFMAALGRVAQRFMDWLTGLFHRQGPRHVERGFLDFKHRAAHLLATRGWLISIATLISDVAGWLVQLTCLRACGVSAAEVSWEKSFAGYALIRLLTTIPITPGGLGITEVGLTAYLASGAGPGVTDRIAAAILLARALTFVVPIPLGAVNFAAWKWLRRKDDPLG